MMPCALTEIGLLSASCNFHYERAKTYTIKLIFQKLFLLKVVDYGISFYSPSLQNLYH